MTGQGAFAVLVPEEIGIAQPRPYHALVTVTYHCRVAADNITDVDEVRQQVAGLLREAFTAFASAPPK